MLRKSPIKIKLTKHTSALADGDYKVSQITGAITVWTPPIRVGDYITEKTAESLTRAYQVTVTV